MLLNFLIHSQSTAETGRGMAIVRVGVDIGGRVGIGASSSKDTFRSFKVPLLLHRALSVVYSGGVGK